MFEGYMIIICFIHVIDNTGADNPIVNVMCLEMLINAVFCLTV